MEFHSRLRPVSRLLIDLLWRIPRQLMHLRLVGKLRGPTHVDICFESVIALIREYISLKGMIILEIVGRK